MVSVVHYWESPGFVGSGTSYVLNLASAGFGTPEAGDVFIAFWSHQTNRSSTAVSGAGATWTRPYSGGAALSIWIGTGATTNGNVTFSANSTGAILLRVVQLRGLNATTMTGPSVSFDTSGNEWSASPVRQAGGGQIAFVLLRAEDATLAPVTFPATATPASGWVLSAGHFAAGLRHQQFGYRIPTEALQNHDLSADGALGDSQTLISVVFGDYTGPEGPNLPPGVDALYVGADPVDALYVGAEST